MNALELRRRTLGKGVYKKTVEGNPAIAQGSLARRYPGIEMQGWTEQAQYEGKNLFDVSSVESKCILQSGGNTATNYDYDTSGFIKVLPGAVYRRTVVGGRGNYYYTADKTFLNDDVNGQVVNVPENAEYLRFSLYTGRGAEIMLNEGNTLLPYEPYTGGAPSPSPDYPQEITSAGKYDEGTGKYQYTIKISDSEESPTKSQTVTLTSDRPLTKWDRLEKRDGQWGWVYKSNMLSAPKAGYIARGSLAKDGKYFTAENLVPDSKISSVPREGSQYCNICNFGNPYQYDGNLFWIYRGSENKNGDLRIGLSDTSIDTKELFEQYISDKDIYIWYETEEETFVPLSESEQEQMNELYTFRPTTVLSNDAGCNMTLTYKTKKSLEVTA